jgi:hypothetical protein
MKQKYKDMLKGALAAKAISPSKSSSDDPLSELFMVVILFGVCGIASLVTVAWSFSIFNSDVNDNELRWLGLSFVLCFGYMLIIGLIHENFPNFFSRLGLAAVVCGLIWMIFLS